MTEAGHSVCAECGMGCNAGEYHPYAACLMFKQCRNSETVRANLQDVRDDSYQQGRVAGIGECKDLVDSFAEAYLLASMVAHSLSPEIHKCIAEFVSSIGGEIAKLAQAAQDEKGVGDAEN